MSISRICKKRKFFLYTWKVLHQNYIRISESYYTQLEQNGLIDQLIKVIDDVKYKEQLNLSKLFDRKNMDSTVTFTINYSHW
jgi:hypothetical protein